MFKMNTIWRLPLVTLFSITLTGCLTLSTDQAIPTNNITPFLPIRADETIDSKETVDQVKVHNAKFCCLYSKLYPSECKNLLNQLGEIGKSCK